MSDSLNAAAFDLITETYRLSACLRERHRLRSLQQTGVLYELDTPTREAARRVLQRQATVEAIARAEGGDAFSSSVGSLLYGLRATIGNAGAEELRNVASDLGLSELSPVTLLEVCADAPDRPELIDTLAEFALVVALSTIAAAGVGAPVLALVGHQAIGAAMLAEAITTFCSVAITEGVLMYRDFQRATSAARQPTLRSNQRGGPSVPPPDLSMFDRPGPGAGVSPVVPVRGLGLPAYLDKLARDERERELDRVIKELTDAAGREGPSREHDDPRPPERLAPDFDIGF